MIDLGAAIGREPIGSTRLVVALGLPTRAYAAPLIAAGVVADRARVASLVDTVAHFDNVCSQPLQAILHLEVSGRRLEGKFGGTAMLRGERWVRIAVSGLRGGAETHFIPPHESLRISLAADAGSTENSTHMRGHLVRRRSFLRHALGNVALANITRESRLECLLVGRRSLICQEASEVMLSVPSAPNATTSQGARLTDLLRIKRLLGPSQPYRSDIVSALTRRAPVAPNGEIPHAIVFDGAGGFIKWRHLWPKSHWVVVLDRTEARCAEAAAAVDKVYFDRGSVEPVSFTVPDLLVRTDVVAFRAAVATGGRRSC